MILEPDRLSFPPASLSPVSFFWFQSVQLFVQTHQAISMVTSTARPAGSGKENDRRMSDFHDLLKRKDHLDTSATRHSRRKSIAIEPRSTASRPHPAELMPVQDVPAATKATAEAAAASSSSSPDPSASVKTSFKDNHGTGKTPSKQRISLGHAANVYFKHAPKTPIQKEIAARKKINASLLHASTHHEDSDTTENIMHSLLAVGDAYSHHCHHPSLHDSSVAAESSFISSDSSSSGNSSGIDLLNITTQSDTTDLSAFHCLRMTAARQRRSSLFSRQHQADELDSQPPEQEASNVALPKDDAVVNNNDTSFQHLLSNNRRKSIAGLPPPTSQQVQDRTRRYTLTAGLPPPLPQQQQPLADATERVGGTSNARRTSFMAPAPIAIKHAERSPALAKWANHLKERRQQRLSVGSDVSAGSGNRRLSLTAHGQGALPPAMLQLSLLSPMDDMDMSMVMEPTTTLVAQYPHVLNDDSVMNHPSRTSLELTSVSPILKSQPSTLGEEDITTSDKMSTVGDKSLILEGLDNGKEPRARQSTSTVGSEAIHGLFNDMAPGRASHVSRPSIASSIGTSTMHDLVAVLEKVGGGEATSPDDDHLPRTSSVMRQSTSTVGSDDLKELFADKNAAADDDAEEDRSAASRKSFHTKDQGEEKQPGSSDTSGSETASSLRNKTPPLTQASTFSSETRPTSLKSVSNSVGTEASTCAPFSAASSLSSKGPLPERSKKLDLANFPVPEAIAFEESQPDTAARREYTRMELDAKATSPFRVGRSATKSHFTPTKIQPPALRASLLTSPADSPARNTRSAKKKRESIESPLSEKQEGGRLNWALFQPSPAKRLEQQQGTSAQNEEILTGQTQTPEKVGPLSDSPSRNTRSSTKRRRDHVAQRNGLSVEEADTTGSLSMKKRPKISSVQLHSSLRKSARPSSQKKSVAFSSPTIAVFNKFSPSCSMTPIRTWQSSDVDEDEDHTAELEDDMAGMLKGVTTTGAGSTPYKSNTSQSMDESEDVTMDLDEQMKLLLKDRANSVTTEKCRLSSGEKTPILHNSTGGTKAGRPIRDIEEVHSASKPSSGSKAALRGDVESPEVEDTIELEDNMNDLLHDAMLPPLSNQRNKSLSPDYEEGTAELEQNMNALFDRVLSPIAKNTHAPSKSSPADEAAGNGSSRCGNEDETEELEQSIAAVFVSKAARDSFEIRDVSASLLDSSKLGNKLQGISGAMTTPSSSLIFSQPDIAEGDVTAELENDMALFLRNASSRADLGPSYNIHPTMELDKTTGDDREEEVQIESLSPMPHRRRSSRKSSRFSLAPASRLSLSSDNIRFLDHSTDASTTQEEGTNMDEQFDLKKKEILDVALPLLEQRRASDVLRILGTVDVLMQSLGSRKISDVMSAAISSVCTQLTLQKDVDTNLEDVVDVNEGDSRCLLNLQTLLRSDDAAIAQELQNLTDAVVATEENELSNWLVTVVETLEQTLDSFNQQLLDRIDLIENQNLFLEQQHCALSVMEAKVVRKARRKSFSRRQVRQYDPLHGGKL